MNTKLYYIIVIFIGTLCSCAGENKTTPVEIISIKNAKNVSYNLSDMELTPLETNDSSLIKSFGGAFAYDGNIYIQSGFCLYNFQAKTGKFNYKRGSDVSVIFEDNGKIYTYYDMTKELTSYNQAGDLLSKRSIINNDSTVYPTNIIPLSSKSYLIRNSFRGQRNKTEEFGILNEDFNFENNLHGLYVNDGFYRNDLVKSKGGFILYAPTFSDSIYKIDDDGIKLMYKLDLGGESVPDNVRNLGLAYAADWINKNLKDTFTGMTTSCFDNGESVIFLSLVSSKLCIICYDKSNRKTTVNEIKYDMSRYFPQLFLTFNKDNIYMFVFDKRDFNKNPYLLTLDTKKLSQNEN